MRHQAEGTRPSWRLILAITIGNGFELYDFTLFSFFALTLAEVFFPENTPMTALLFTLSTFGAGFVTRPLGSVIIGAFADRVGRGRAITVSFALMMAGTAIVALCPGYESIGLFAPLLLLVGRLVQGFGLGGEIGPTTVLLWESAGEGRRNRFVGFQMASQGASAALGALAALALRGVFSEAEILAGAWRIPFLAGLVIGPFGLYLRATMRQEPTGGRRQARPLRLAFVEYRRQVVAGLLLIMTFSTSSYVIVFYVPTYLVHMIGLAPSSALLAGVVAGIVMLAVAPAVGILADRSGVLKPFVLVAALGTALFVLPVFWLMLHGAPLWGILAGVAVLVLFNAIGAGPGLALILTAFPPGARATGLSTAYGLGIAVFGGFAQFIVTALIAMTGEPTAPAWYVMAAAAISLAGVALIRPARLADAACAA